MAISLSEASTPVFAQMLGAMVGVLDRLSAHCAERKIEPAVLLGDRLFPNMYPLGRQLRLISDWANNTCAWLAGQQPLAFANDEATIADYRQRLVRTIEFIESLDKAAIDAGEAREIVWKAGVNTRRMLGKDFLLHQALPQFFFHQTTAYAILRHNGIDLAKRDYMGVVPRMTQS
ncbi:MAG TPA: DUF1993 domain-containing protein [Beijerinckiaceae bacterium]